MKRNVSLLFVYNADSSLFNQVGDFIHKTISPKTYPCRLCGLTYSGVSMRSEWKGFIRKLQIPVKFLHKDEFVDKYSKFSNISLPAVFLEKNGKLAQFITSKEINKLHTLLELEKLVLLRVE